MQLTPFKRPNINQIRETRGAIASTIPGIRHHYADPNKAAPPSEWDLSEWSPTPDPAEVKVGDLHDWDKLVDGCLYIDRNDKSGRPYLAVLAGSMDWTARRWGFDGEWLSTSAGAAFSEMAEVVAVGLRNPREFIDAIREHAASLKTGGAK